MAVLAEGTLEAGRHTVLFDPAGAGLPSGMYLYRLQSESEVATSRLMLVRGLLEPPSESRPLRDEAAAARSFLP